MVERTNPGSAGVVAGRVVGLLSVLLTVAVLLTHEETFYRSVRAVLAALETGAGIPVWAIFWGNVVLVAAGRYALCYVVGSLIGVGYDWLDRPGLAFLAVAVFLIGIVDGTYAALSARSALVGTGFVLAWLAYLPVFVWVFEEGEERSGPRRLGEL